jgi:hypothetical protein
MLGPSLVGWLADHVYTAAGGVGPAMATVSLLIGVPGLLILWAGLRPYAAEVSHGLGKAGD